jgi:hypothetical protein
MMTTLIRNMSQVVDYPAPEAGWSKERQEDSQGSAQVADSPTPKAERPGLSLDSLSLKVGQASQHGSSVTDGPASETGRSAATQRPPSSSEGGVIEKFKDLDKLGQRFTSADPLEEIDIGDRKTPRPTFVNKTLETNSRDEMIGLLKEYSNCFAWNYTEMPGLS